MPSLIHAYAPFQIKRLEFIKNRADHDENIVNMLDLNEIDRKVDAKAYSTTEAFASDIRWIIHNLSIIYPRKFALYETK